MVRHKKEELNFSTSKSYHRQPYDTHKSWEAFNIYLNLGTDRTLDKVRQQLERKPSYLRVIQDWSGKHHWALRASAFDTDEEAIVKNIIRDERKKRHLTKIENYQKESEILARNMIAQGVKMMQLATRKLAMISEQDLMMMTPFELVALSKTSINLIEFGRMMEAETFGIEKMMEVLNASKK